ncbi:hypothetical protein ACTFIY_010959 [Dictyostelium cf. discoideum]
MWSFTFSKIIANYLCLESIDLIEYTMEKYKLNVQEKPLLYSIPFYDAIVDLNVDEILKINNLNINGPIKEYSIFGELLLNSFNEIFNIDDDGYTDERSNNFKKFKNTFIYLVNSKFKNLTTTALKEILNLFYIKNDEGRAYLDENDYIQEISISTENLEERFLHCIIQYLN